LTLLFTVILSGISIFISFQTYKIETLRADLKLTHILTSPKDKVCIMDGATLDPKEYLRLIIKLENVGKISSENTKLLFEFDNIVINEKFVDSNGRLNIDEIDEFYNSEWEFKYDPYSEEKSFNKAIWSDDGILYPTISKEIVIDLKYFKVLPGHKSIKIKAVSKNAEIKTYDINFNYIESNKLSDYFKNH